MSSGRNKLGIYGRGILAIIIGLLMALYPDFIQQMLFQVIGIIFIFGGVVAAFSYFRMKNEDGEKNRKIVSAIPFTAIISVILGIIILVKYEFMLEMTVFILGFLLILVGVGQLMMMMAMRSGSKFNLWMFIIPVIVILSGVFICFNPFSAVRKLFIFFGFVTMFYGVADIVMLIAFKNNKKDKEDKIQESEKLEDTSLN